MNDNKTKYFEHSKLCEEHFLGKTGLLHIFFYCLGLNGNNFCENRVMNITTFSIISCNLWFIRQLQASLINVVNYYSPFLFITLNLEISLNCVPQIGQISKLESIFSTFTKPAGIQSGNTFLGEKLVRSSVCFYTGTLLIQKKYVCGKVSCKYFVFFSYLN